MLESSRGKEWERTNEKKARAVLLFDKSAFICVYRISLLLRAVIKADGTVRTDWQTDGIRYRTFVHGLSSTRTNIFVWPRVNKWGECCVRTPWIIGCEMALIWHIKTGRQNEQKRYMHFDAVTFGHHHQITSTDCDFPFWLRSFFAPSLRREMRTHLACESNLDFQSVYRLFLACWLCADTVGVGKLHVIQIRFANTQSQSSFLFYFSRCLSHSLSKVAALNFKLYDGSCGILFFIMANGNFIFFSLFLSPGTVDAVGARPPIEWHT